MKTVDKKFAREEAIKFKVERLLEGNIRNISLTTKPVKRKSNLISAFDFKKYSFYYSEYIIKSRGNKACIQEVENFGILIAT